MRPLETSEDELAIDVIAERAACSDGYLSSSHTLKWFRKETYIPSDLIDRGTRREFDEQGCKDVYERAMERVEEILADYSPPEQDLSKKQGTG
ncbi:MAG: trimethylamine methyltransferase family protein [Desulfatiglandales bacterium]